MCRHCRAVTMVEAEVQGETTVLLGGRRREAALMRQVMTAQKTMMGITNSTIPPTTVPALTATLPPESGSGKTA